MTLGKRLLLYSSRDPSAADLARSTADWGCLVSNCSSIDELRGRIEGADYDLVLVAPSAALQRLATDSSPEETLHLTLAEVEKRHIQRVLGIDTKTLYNKLKSYKSSESVARKRLMGSGSMTII